MSQSESRRCQNCKTDFEITPDDEAFYQKIDVPPPTFCPECRLIRKLTWRNERVLYRNECSLCGQKTMSMHSPEMKRVVYCRSCWHSDKWDGQTFQKEYDWNVPFFAQHKELQETVPVFNLLLLRDNPNSDFSNFLAGSKSAYLSYSIVDVENVRYVAYSDKCKECVDCFGLKDSELCYESMDGVKNYRTTYSIDSKDCMNSSFIFSCSNCDECFMSSNLRNKRFVFRNKQLGADEYKEVIKSINLGSDSVIKELRDEFFEMKKKSLHKFARIVNSDNCSGNNIENSTNSKRIFNGHDVENVSYSVRVFDLKDGMDCCGTGRCELMYESVVAGFGGYNSKFIHFTDVPHSLTYCTYCYNSSHLFGCVGLRNKEYCILNKQYTKEEYESLIPRIKSHMNDMPYIDKNGLVYKYGEFFPADISLFAYNETKAQEYFPLTKNEALSRGFRWKDEDERKYNPTITSENLPDNIKDVPDSITNEIIQCAHSNCVHQCTTAFKIIPEELQFYKRMNLPIPRLCPNCRHYERLSQRNPLKLWHRQCMKEGCTNEFETSYAPERPEIVYCEQCYQAEVA